MLIPLMTAVALMSVKQEAPPPKEVQFTIRICRGDPKGSVEAGTMRVMTNTSVGAVKGRPAYIFSGRERPVLRDGNVEYLRFGIRVEMTAKSMDNRKAELEVEFEDSSREGSPKLRAAMSGRFGYGDPVRLFLPTPPGEPQTWAEIIVDKAARRQSDLVARLQGN